MYRNKVLSLLLTVSFIMCAVSFSVFADTTIVSSDYMPDALQTFYDYNFNDKAVGTELNGEHVVVDGDNSNKYVKIDELSIPLDTAKAIISDSDTFSVSFDYMVPSSITRTTGIRLNVRNSEAEPGMGQTIFDIRTTSGGYTQSFFSLWNGAYNNLVGGTGGTDGQLVLSCKGYPWINDKDSWNNFILNFIRISNGDGTYNVRLSSIYVNGVSLAENGAKFINVDSEYISENLQWWRDNKIDITFSGYGSGSVRYVDNVKVYTPKPFASELPDLVNNQITIPFTNGINGENINGIVFTENQNSVDFTAALGTDNRSIVVSPAITMDTDNKSYVISISGVKSVLGETAADASYTFGISPGMYSQGKCVFSSNGNALSGALQSGQELSVTANVSNMSNSENTAAALVALYSGNNLAGIGCGTTNLLANTSGYVTASMTVPTINNSIAYTVKGFVWENNSFRPLSNVSIYNNVVVNPNELLDNPSFETAITNLKLFGYAGNTNIKQITEDVHTGGYALKVPRTSRYQGFQYTVTDFVTVDGNYLFKAYVKGDNATINLKPEFYVEYESDTSEKEIIPSQLVTVNSSEWTEISVSTDFSTALDATKTIKSVRLVIESTDVAGADGGFVGFLVDDVSLIDLDATGTDIIN